MTAIQRGKNKQWYVGFWYNHKRYRKKSPDNSRAGALAYEAMLRQKLARGEPLEPAQQDKHKKEQEQKFKEYGWKWLDAKTNKKRSSVHHMKHVLSSALIPFFGETSLDKISTPQVERYKAEKKGKLSNKTINNHLIVLSSCLSGARESFGLAKPRIEKLDVDPQKVDFLSFQEYDLLLVHSHGIWRELILMAGRTGMRQGELRGLDWSDINWSNKTLTVWHSWCDYKNGLTSPKSGKERHLQLTRSVYETLLRRKQTTGFVFPDPNNGNRRLDSKRLNNEIAKACKAAGIRTITCHTLRHTFASHMVMRGAPLKTVQEMLGHADIQTTMRYTHLAPSIMQDAVDLLEPTEKVPPDSGHYLDTGQHLSIGVQSFQKAA